MTAWPGGPCPSCGENMPEKLIHCQVCRALLNPELNADSVEIPTFVPLQEIEAMVEVRAQGHYVQCPGCSKELRINKKYSNQEVSCKFCRSPFKYSPAETGTRVVAMYSACPHCQKEIRAALKYLGMKVACKHCSGRIQLEKAGPV